MRNYFRIGLRTIFFAFALCLTLSAVALSQQETSATITGNVTDAAGAVVSNATVTVTNKSTGIERRVQTNGDGNYVVTPLTPGTYTVAIEQTNFKRNVQENVFTASSGLCCTKVSCTGCCVHRSFPVRKSTHKSVITS